MAERIPLKFLFDAGNNPIAAAEFAADDTIPAIYVAALASGGTFQLAVYNQTGATLDKSAVVHVNDFKSGDNLPTVDLADASDPDKMPAIGLMNAAVPNNAAGIVDVIGFHEDFDTFSFNIIDDLYVSPTTPGTLTNVKPDADKDHAIQRLGIVTRSHPNLGKALILGAGRSNDVPNTVDTILGIFEELRVATQTPASASATGVAGTVTWDSDYIYVCTATDTWKRTAISTW